MQYPTRYNNLRVFTMLKLSSLKGIVFSAFSDPIPDTITYNGNELIAGIQSIKEAVKKDNTFDGRIEITSLDNAISTALKKHKDRPSQIELEETQSIIHEIVAISMDGYEESDIEQAQISVWNLFEEDINSFDIEKINRLCSRYCEDINVRKSKSKIHNEVCGTSYMSNE